MEKLLKKFANNELYAMEVVEKRSPERQKLIEKSDRIHDKLEQKLNTEEKEILEQLLDVIYEESCYYAQDNFIRGYRLGVLMTMEIFSEQDTFL